MERLDKIGKGRGQSCEQSRIEWIDTAKGIGLLFVMLGHCYLDRKYTYWFTSFHMGLFFFLSGYTFRLKNEYYFSFLKRKVMTLVVPYCFLAFITMACDGLLAATHGREYEIGKIVLLYIIQKRYTLLWYLACLFVSENILYPIVLFNKADKRNRLYLMISIVLITVFFSYKAILKIDLPWNADLAVLAVPFMLLGMYVRGSEMLAHLLEKKSTVFITAFICLALSTGQFYYYGAVDWYANAFGNPVFFIISAVSGTVAVVSFSRLVRIPTVSKLGENSILLYGLHRIVIDLSFTLYGKIGIVYADGSPVALVWAVLSVVISIVVLLPFNRIVKKYFPWALGRIG